MGEYNRNYNDEHYGPAVMAPATGQSSNVWNTSNLEGAGTLLGLLPQNLRDTINQNQGVLWKGGLRRQKVGTRKGESYLTNEWEDNLANPDVSARNPGYKQIDPYQMSGIGGYSGEYGGLLSKAGISAGDPRLNSVFKYDPEYGLLASTDFWDKLRGGATQTLDAKNNNFFDKYGASAIGSLALGGAGFAPAFFAGAQTLQNGGGLADLFKNYAFSKLGGAVGKSLGSGISSSIGGRLGSTLGRMGGNLGGNALVNLVRGRKMNPRSLLLSSILSAKRTR